jgi:hypothetical protein
MRTQLYKRLQKGEKSVGLGGNGKNAFCLSLISISKVFLCLSIPLCFSHTSLELGTILEFFEEFPSDNSLLLTNTVTQCFTSGIEG